MGEGERPGFGDDRLSLRETDLGEERLGLGGKTLGEGRPNLSEGRPDLGEVRPDLGEEEWPGFGDCRRKKGLGDERLGLQEYARGEERRPALGEGGRLGPCKTGFGEGGRLSLDETYFGEGGRLVLGEWRLGLHKGDLGEGERPLWRQDLPGLESALAESCGKKTTAHIYTVSYWV